MFEIFCLALCNTPFTLSITKRGRKPRVDVSFNEQLLFTFYKTPEGFSFTRYPHPSSEQYLRFIKQRSPYLTFVEIF